MSGGGTIFAVSKRNSVNLREVWHGAQVSAAAKAPPRPPWLASPTALLDLESSEDSPIRLSKRDGKCLFDQMRLLNFGSSIFILNYFHTKIVLFISL